MPVANSSETPWTGWLLSGAPESRASLLEKIRNALDREQWPKVSVNEHKLNMWYSDTTCIDVVSTLDGTSTCTIHVNEYGDGLFVGLAWRGDTTNYYKHMTGACLVTVVMSCITAVIAATGAEPRTVNR